MRTRDTVHGGCLAGSSARTMTTRPRRTPGPRRMRMGSPMIRSKGQATARGLPTLSPCLASHIASACSTRSGSAQRCSRSLGAPAGCGACGVLDRGSRRFGRCGANRRAHCAPPALPGQRDASAVLQRARDRCTSLRFARAVAGATQRAGVPAIGRRMRIVGVDLVGVRRPGAVAGALDLVRTDRSARSDAGPRDVPRSFGAARRQSPAAPAAIVWSAGPDTCRHGIRSCSRASLRCSRARAGRSIDAVAGASVRAFAPAGPAAAVSRAGRRRAPDRRCAPRTRRAPQCWRLRDDRERRDRGPRLRARSCRCPCRLEPHRRPLVHARRAPRCWYRALARCSGRLPHPPTADHVAALADRLLAAVGPLRRRAQRARSIPGPATRSSTRSRSRSRSTSPPSCSSRSTTLRARRATGSTSASNPAPRTIAWDGAAADGAILGPGEYRYAVRAIDLAGNRLVLAGLGGLRDRSRHDAAGRRPRRALRYVTGAPLGARVVARWNVVEPLSPHVRTTLVLASGATRHRSCSTNGPACAPAPQGAPRGRHLARRLRVRRRFGKRDDPSRWSLRGTVSTECSAVVQLRRRSPARRSPRSRCCSPPRPPSPRRRIRSCARSTPRSRARS